MMMKLAVPCVEAHAIRTRQASLDVYASFLPGERILEIAEISRIGRGTVGDIVGFQRVGLISMGYVMDELAIRFGSKSQAEFATGLRPLVGRTHWTEGEWDFGTERRPWNSLQNTKAVYRLLSHHPVRIARRGNARVGAVA